MGLSDRTNASGFYRTIPLPEGVTPDQITANYDNGVLELTMPIPEQQRGRRIEIQAGPGEKQPGRPERAA